MGCRSCGRAGIARAVANVSMNYSLSESVPFGTKRCPEDGSRLRYRLKPGPHYVCSLKGHVIKVDA